MIAIDMTQLAHVCGGREHLRQVLRAAKHDLDVPADQAYGTTIDFINRHSFFHRGLMNAPIGIGGRHGRNVPVLGPLETLKGRVHHNASQVARGHAITHGTWDAP